MTQDVLKEALATASGRLAALRTYQRTHGVEPPFLRGTEAQVRSLTAELAAREDKAEPMTDMNIMTSYLATVQDEMRTIHTAAANRALTAQEQSRWDELSRDAEEVEKNLARARQEDERAKRVAQRRAEWGSLQVSVHDSDPVNAEDALRMDSGTARDTALRMLDTSARHLTDDQRAGLDKLIRSDSTPNCDVDVLNRHIVATCNDDYRAAFRKLTEPRMSNIITLSEREAAAVLAVNRSMLEGTGSTGGYMVPAYLDPTIALNAQGSANPIRKLARNEVISTKQWKGVGTQGVTWSFVPEGDPSTDASPSVSQPTIDVHTARAWITYSIELQQDAVELDAQLFRLLANGWDESLAGVLATGSGSGAPKGIVTALDATPASEVTITTPGSLAPADISKVWVALPDRARESASWVMHESVREAIAAWGDEYGNRSVDLGGRLKTLRERPVHSTDKFPAIATTTASANQVVVGDFSGYLIVQRAGMAVEPVQTVVNGDGLPVGKRGLFAWARIGADVIDAGLLRLLKQ